LGLAAFDADMPLPPPPPEEKPKLCETATPPAKASSKM
jgi:hypothetical protein